MVIDYLGTLLLCQRISLHSSPPKSSAAQLVNFISVINWEEWHVRWLPAEPFAAGRAMRSTGTEHAAESQTRRGSVVNPDPVFEKRVIGRQGRIFAPFGLSFA